MDCVFTEVGQLFWDSVEIGQNRQRTKCTEHASEEVRPSKRLELYIFQIHTVNHTELLRAREREHWFRSILVVSNCGFPNSVAQTPFCAIPWRSPKCLMRLALQALREISTGTACHILLVPPFRERERHWETAEHCKHSLTSPCQSFPWGLSLSVSFPEYPSPSLILGFIWFILIKEFPSSLQKWPQYCWEFHDQLWEALSGTTSEEKRGVSF